MDTASPTVSLRGWLDAVSSWRLATSFSLRKLTAMRQQTILPGYGAQSLLGRQNLQSSVSSKLHGRYGAARSLDLLRQNIQSLVNRDVDALLKNYLEKFFQPALVNIRNNLGDDSLTEHSLRIVCIQMLEEAKAQYYVSKKSKADGQRETALNGKVVQPMLDVKTSCHVGTSNGGGIESIDSLIKDLPTQSSAAMPYKRRDAEVDGGWERNRKKLLKTVTNVLPGSPTPIKVVKLEQIRREGPKWDPNRITNATLFIMGARANKVLGFGQNRGRLYTKHPELMKYSGDTEDKEWLSRNNLMPPTGGIAYLLVLDDIRELAHCEDYRHNPNVLLTELKGFYAPDFMLMKIRMFMAQIRTEGQENPSSFPYFEQQQHMPVGSTNQLSSQFNNYGTPQAFHSHSPVSQASTCSIIEDLITETANYMTSQPVQPPSNGVMMNMPIDFHSDYF